MCEATENLFKWVTSCHGFVQKRLASESTLVTSNDHSQPLKHADVLMPVQQESQMEFTQYVAVDSEMD